jgi:hypothetical protein
MEREVSIYPKESRFVVDPPVVGLNENDTLRVYNDTGGAVTPTFPGNILTTKNGVPIPPGRSALYDQSAERRPGRFRYLVAVVTQDGVEAAEGASAPRIIIR